MELVTIQPQPLCVRRSDLQYPLNGSLGGSLRQFGSFEGQKNISFKCYNVLCNISLKEQLPEDAHSRWPKHVSGYFVHNTVNVHYCICTCWLYSHIEPITHQCLVGLLISRCSKHIWNVQQNRRHFSQFGFRKIQTCFSCVP